MIRNIEEKDIQTCLDIYNYYIENTTVTLEMEKLSMEEFADRVHTISSGYPYLVYEQDGKVLGYAYVHEFSPRGGYRYTVEVTIYLDHTERGKGIGRELMTEILFQCKSRGYRDVISVITGENQESIAFHKAMGFSDAFELKGVADKLGRRFSVCWLQYNIC